MGALRLNKSDRSEMRTERKLAALLFLGSLLSFAFAIQAVAQSTNAVGDKQLTAQPGGNGGQSDGKGRPSITERPTVIPRDPATATQNENPANGKGQGKPESPGRPDQPALPGEVKDLVSKFQVDRETFLSQRQELQRQLKTASELERAAIREQMRDKLEAWKLQQQEALKEYKDRVKDMKNELNPVYSPFLGQPQDGGGKVRN
jgi:hypothetical protein